MRIQSGFRTLEFSYRSISDAEIVLKGLDDPEKSKGIESYSYVYFDELNQFFKEEWQQADLSLRGIPGQKLFASWNPVSEESWVKKELIDTYEWEDTDKYGTLPGPFGFIRISTDGTAILIKTTYHDNYWISGHPSGEYGYRDEALITTYERLKDWDEDGYRVNVLGEWGRYKTGSEYYPQFSEVKHVGSYPFVQSLPIVHLTYDFNVVPYMTLLAAQYIEEPQYIRIRIFKEYCLPSPLNTTTAVSEAFIDDYEKYIQWLFYYGDASGNNRIAGKGDEVNYDDVREALSKWVDDSSDRVSNSNKPVLKRRKLLMKLLAGQLFVGTRQVVLEIDESCKETIRDFKYLKLGPNGKHKEKVEKNGVKYEDYGHGTDAAEYLICYLFEEYL